MKNFATLYNSQNLSSAIEQSIFVKTETQKALAIAPLGTDAIEQTAANVAFAEPRDPSPHKSGRDHVSLIRRKNSTEISLTTAVNIDTSLGGPTSGQIDQAMRALLLNTLGFETETPNLRYNNSEAPDDSFTMLDNGDKQANQAIGAFIQTMTINIPGADIPTFEFTGMAKTAFNAGIGVSTSDNNGGNIISLDNINEACRFEVGALVMVIKADGLTRSDDTATGTFRRVVSSNEANGQVELDGAVLADSDGSGGAIYLAYYEPEGVTKINDIQTDLTGDVVVGSLPAGNCVRSMSITLNNNHEVEDDCYGESGLTDALYAASDKFTVEVSIELNLNDDLVEFITKRKNFELENVVATIGSTTGRRMQITMARLQLNVPAVVRPETGRVPVTFEGIALASDSGAGDAIVIDYL